ncbi:MAG: SGNH/GDSL hydrolase family protein, partial [Myxococcota bacterium]|nr:SGNH/GDSL hydrolase family protein [Myxococcota bacterium]
MLARADTVGDGQGSGGGVDAGPTPEDATGVATDGGATLDGVASQEDVTPVADATGPTDGVSPGDGTGEVTSVGPDGGGVSDTSLTDAVSTDVPTVTDDAGSEDDGGLVAADVQSDGGSTGELIGPLCFSEIWDPTNPGPDYDQFSPVVGSHCLGTNHQDIVGVEQVVIFGDSVTQGTPNDHHPTCLENEHFYRNELSEWLADTYNLDRGNLIDWGLFKSYDCLYTGGPGKQTSGDFHNCSKWGARTDDLLSGGGQIPQCFPSYPAFGSDKTTLVFFTMGGNDISTISQAGAEASTEEVAAGYPEAWALAESTIAYLEEAVKVFKDPALFPNGAYVVYANPFEFTDGTGQTSSCSPEEINIPLFGTIDISAFGIDLAGLAGYG